MLEQKVSGSYKVYIPSRRLVYSVRKFVHTKSYSLLYGWKRREQLVYNDKEYENVEIKKKKL